MIKISDHYRDDLSLKDKILFVLSKLNKAAADEVAMEIMELQGISSEEGVAEITDEVKEELVKLCENGTVEKVKDHRQKVRYVLNAASE